MVSWHASLATTARLRAKKPSKPPFSPFIPLTYQLILIQLIANFVSFHEPFAWSEVMVYLGWLLEHLTFIWLFGISICPFIPVFGNRREHPTVLTGSSQIKACFPFHPPLDDCGWGGACERIGAMPTWSRSLLPYDQRDWGALDFSEQTLRDAPGLLQQLRYPLCLSVQRTYQTNCRHKEQRYFFFLFLSWLQTFAAGCHGDSRQKHHKTKWGPVVNTNSNASRGNASAISATALT